MSFYNSVSSEWTKSYDYSLFSMKSCNDDGWRKKPSERLASSEYVYIFAISALSRSLGEVTLFQVFSLRSLHILCCAKLHFRAYSYRRGKGYSGKGRTRKREKCLQTSECGVDEKLVRLYETLRLARYLAKESGPKNSQNEALLNTLLLCVLIFTNKI